MEDDRLQPPSLLVLVRHAESAHNAAQHDGHYLCEDAPSDLRETGDHRLPLTPAGVQQARATGVALRTRFGAFDHVFTSGFVRTTETARELLSAYSSAELKGTAERAEILLRERDRGYLHYLTRREAEAAFPWLERYWQIQGDVLSRPPGGESLADVVARVSMFVDRLARQCAGRRVLVVTHSGTVRSFRYLLEGWECHEAEELPTEAPRNCGITVYQPDASTGVLRLVEYNTVYSTP
jgi:broad specificity phosphatase PhoE